MPLEPVLRSRLEQLMGFDLGSVRLHTDSAAASLAFQMRAHAFTVGPHVFFAAGKFQPQTRAGLALLAHELSHVRQQPEGAPLQWGQLTFTQHRTLEQEADAQQEAVLAGGTLPAFRDYSGGLSPMGTNYEGRSRLGGDHIGLPLRAAAPRGGGEAFPPLILSWPSRTMAVVPLRQEVTTAPELPAPAVGAPPAAPSATPAPEAPDPEELAQQVYEWIQRRLRIERERRGIQRWH
ncbi:MAG: DUF4157 domain-containing protein [Candidatus Methylomirabilales bacterium]